jgi:hypothetical protein
MQNLLTVATQVGILFALMGVGALCRRCRLVDESAVKGIVNILILIVTPCLIVDVFQQPFDTSMMHGFVWAIIVAFLAHTILVVTARLFAFGDDNSRPVLRLAIVFSNAGFMGIPLEQAILGAKGVFYGAVYIVMFNIFIWSWGLCEMRRNNDCGSSHGLKWKELRPMIVNPGTIGIAAGLPLFLLSTTLPSIVRTPVSLMAALNTPLAMIVIGFYLAGADFRRVVRTPCAYVAAAIRLIAFPLAMIALLFPFRSHFPREMMLAIVIAASAPVAAMVSMFAAKFGRDVDLSVGLVSGTTLLSILTMPPVIVLAMGVL